VGPGWVHDALNRATALGSRRCDQGKLGLDLAIDERATQSRSLGLLACCDDIVGVARNAGNRGALKGWLCTSRSQDGGPVEETNVSPQIIDASKFSMTIFNNIRLYVGGWVLEAIPQLIHSYLEVRGSTRPSDV
jgi:hypothetical protein